MSKSRFSDRFGKSGFTPPSERELNAIIVEGDPEVLVTVAQRLGGELARSLTTSQIRNIFGTVRQIEMNWPADPKAGQIQASMRQLLLLKPRLAYQAARHRRGVSDLAQVLTSAIDLVEQDRNRLQYFVDFFEAILAYHAAAGGR